MLVIGELSVFKFDTIGKTQHVLGFETKVNMETQLTASPLGLKRSFGFGDRLGLATSGHIAALKAKGAGFLPIFAQQSIREMTRTDRTAKEVMQAAVESLKADSYTGIWGADADHLKNQQDVNVTAAAGFCFFTIDPSDFVNNAADNLGAAELEAEIQKQNSENLYGDASLETRYLNKSFDIAGQALQFDKETLWRAGVKYGRAVAHCERMAGFIAEANPNRLFEIEVSVDETDSPTSHLEHLFFALELRRRGVTIVSLAPRFIGEFEKGIDYKGDLKAFEVSLQTHVAIAREMGPYKISIHSGSDKFSIYPVIGRVCGDLLHVKTAGTSYLEALRVLARVQPEMFQEVIRYSGERFSEDKVSYHISVTDSDIPGLMQTSKAHLEQVFLDEDRGRQLLHVTFGSVLTKGRAADGRRFKDHLLDVLHAKPELHIEVLEKHLGKHLQQLNAG